jgi:adenosylcobinamide-GDP ribazoletransferase
MKRGLARFLSVFTLVSRIPVKAAFDPDFSRADFWLPLVGLPAAAVSLAAWLAARWAFGDPTIAAIAALAAQYSAFNLFHLDGLLDSADAMAGHLPAERRLEILKDSRIGSYAFFFGIAELGAKVAALAALGTLGPVPAAAALLAAPVGGRLAGALVPTMSRPARPDGLGSLMKGQSRMRAAAGWAIGSLALAAGWATCPGLGALPWAAAAGASLIGALLGSLSISSIYSRRVGGFTGDAIGAAVEVGELACALVLLAALRLAG